RPPSSGRVSSNAAVTDAHPPPTIATLIRACSLTLVDERSVGCVRAVVWAVRRNPRRLYQTCGSVGMVRGERATASHEVLARHPPEGEPEIGPVAATGRLEAPLEVPLQRTPGNRRPGGAGEGVGLRRAQTGAREPVRPIACLGDDDHRCRGACSVARVLRQ